VIGEEIEYAGLDGAFLTHCRAPAVAVSLISQCTRPGGFGYLWDQATVSK